MQKYFGRISTWSLNPRDQATSTTRTRHTVHHTLSESVCSLFAPGPLGIPSLTLLLCVRSSPFCCAAVHEEGDPEAYTSVDIQLVPQYIGETPYCTTPNPNTRAS